MKWKRGLLAGAGALVAIVALALILFPIYATRLPSYKNQAFQNLVRRAQQPVEHSGVLVGRVTWLMDGDPRRAREYQLYEDGSSWTFRVLYNYATQGGNYGEASAAGAKDFRKVLQSMPASTIEDGRWEPDMVMVTRYVDSKPEMRVYSKETLPAEVKRVVNRKPEGLVASRELMD